MGYAIGIVLALLTALFARRTRFDRDRAFYPTVLIVVASYYILFAALGGSGHALLLESIQLTVFASIAVIGFNSNPWWVVLGLAGHGLFDLVHGRVISNPGVPPWWPSFCMAFDVFIAAILAWLLSRKAATTRHDRVSA